MTKRELSAAAKPELTALTGLRGVGALWVFGLHWNLLTFSTGRGYPGLRIGYLGVDLFFILSGFVMCYSQRSAFTSFTLIDYVRFLQARILRIYPTSIFVLILFMAAVAILPLVIQDSPAGTYTLRGAILQLLLVHNWLGLVAIWNIPTWSLSAELAAYLALPAVLLLVARLGRWNALLAPLCLLALAVILILHGEHDTNVKNHGAPLRLAAEFTTGAAIFGAWQSNVALPVKPTTWITAILLSFAIFFPRQEAAFAALPALALLVWLGAEGDGLICRLLSSPPIEAAGRISYSLYLLHWPVFVFWRHVHGFLQAPAWANALMLWLTLAASALLHLAVEAPSHRFAQRLRRRMVNVAASGRMLSEGAA